MAWLLTLYAALTLAVMFLPSVDPALLVLSLVIVAVLLAVYGVGDVFRNIWEQLRLPPPEERGA